MIEAKFVQRIAEELSITPAQVGKAIELLEGGATIPFIARYRKDATEDLDEVRLEAIAKRNSYFTGLTERRGAVLEAIAKVNRLTDDVRTEIENCLDKTALEDLYLPYKKKRNAKATLARQKGLSPLADYIWAQVPGEQGLIEYATTFARPEKALSSVEEALEGARQILAERLGEDLALRAMVRQRLLGDGKIAAHATKNAEGKRTKFEAYYEFSEPADRIPSHRYLAILRGVKEGVLRMELVTDDAQIVEDFISHFVKTPSSEFEPIVREVVSDAYNRLLRPSIESEVLDLLRTRADEEAIRVFRANAESLLLAPPAGRVPVIGIDPGSRSACKLAVVDKDGAFLESATVFPNPPQSDAAGAEKVLAELMEKHGANAIAVGSGTSTREAARFLKQALTKLGKPGAFVAFVSEAGASVYSSSKHARDEFPDLDGAFRAAITIARRLQDPLAELVKLEPRHISVGQHQHDVNQRLLRDGLHRTVVSCVNRVGVDLNTASADLLRYVSGFQANAARNVVEFRSKIGGFTSREQLKEVDGVGARVFEQAAGFLRVRNGANPLDATGIHPNAYAVVERMAEAAGVPVGQLLGNREAVRQVDLGHFAGDTIGPFSLRDIREELLRPGLDPRPQFRVPKFMEGVESVGQLEEGMETEGVVTNVTDFGAFVDIGVDQDGLVHLSEMANRFVQDPRQFVKVGDVVKVKVIKVNKELPRISLSMKALLPPPEAAQHRPRPRGRRPGGPEPHHAPDSARPESHQAPGEGTAPETRPPREDRPRDERPRRDPRRAGPPRDERPRDARPRDERRLDDRPRDQRRGKGQAPGRGPRDQRPRPDRRERDSGGAYEPVNTLLADQLAALREKFGS